MRAATASRPVSECSPKATGPRPEVHNVVELADLTAYFRRERGMSRRNAQFLAREVYRSATVSAEHLPTGWHEAIHPPAVAWNRPAPLAEPMTPTQHREWLAAGGDRANA